MGTPCIKGTWGAGMKKKSVSDMTVEECIEKFLELEFDPRICRVPEDYGKKNVKEHNKVVRILIAFSNELDGNIKLAEKVYSELLKHEDEGIQYRAASVCLIKLNIHIEKSVEVLECLAKTDIPWYSYPSKCHLEKWRGESGPNDP
jgi:hypothetical protein